MNSPLPVMGAKPSYWRTQEKPLFEDLAWNIPEQKQGRIAIIGGQAQNFALPVKLSEYAAEVFPFETVTTVLPDAVKIPKMPNVEMVRSTASGSLADGTALSELMTWQDANLLIDCGKNSITREMIANLVMESKGKLVISRDAVDALRDLPAENDGVTLIASMAQLQRLFREMYYPKVLLLSMPLLAAVEALHKFTLSYSCTILTFHEGQIITARDGKVISTPIEKTAYSPLSLWQGQLAIKALGMMLYSPGQPLEALNAAIFYA